MPCPVPIGVVVNTLARVGAGCCKVMPAASGVRAGLAHGEVAGAATLDPGGLGEEEGFEGTVVSLVESSRVDEAVVGMGEVPIISHAIGVTH